MLNIESTLTRAHDGGQVDTAEFEDFFRITFPMLVRYALRRYDQAMAEDLAAKTMQTLWLKNQPAPADELEVRRLQSLAYRVLEGHMRNASRAETAFRQAHVAASLAEAPRSARDISDEVILEGWPGWAEALSMTDREVLGLVVDGYRVSEIAIILDCSPAAITMRLRRARRNAQLLWAREVADDSDR